MGLYLNGWPVGIGIALVAQPEIATVLGPEWVFYATAVAAGAALALTGLLYRPAPDSVASSAADRLRLSRTEVGLVILAAVLWTLSNSAHSVVLAFGPGYVESFGYSSLEAGAIVSINLWIAVVMVPLGGLLASRIGRPSAFIALTAAVGGTAMVLMSAYPSQFVLLFAMMGVFLFAPASVYVSLPVEVLRPQNRATGLGVFYTLWYSGMAGIPPVGGWTLDVTGAPSAPILFAGLLVLAIPPMLLVFRLAQRRTATA
jgi:MFS family permease